jgi:hypothetical protein
MKKSKAKHAKAEIKPTSFVHLPGPATRSRTAASLASDIDTAAVSRQSALTDQKIRKRKPAAAHAEVESAKKKQKKTTGGLKNDQFGSAGKLPNRSMEFQLMERGNKAICGVDEAGRGPLAGPVVAAAVVLPKDFDCSNIDDSKKLTEDEVQ